MAEWLIGELRKQGMGTDEKPGQETLDGIWISKQSVSVTLS